MIAWTPPESERGLGSVLLSPQQAVKLWNLAPEEARL